MHVWVRFLIICSCKRIENSKCAIRTFLLLYYCKIATWLWRWRPLRLSKRQTPTTVLFRTTVTVGIELNFVLIWEHICYMKSPLSYFDKASQIRHQQIYGAYHLAKKKIRISRLKFKWNSQSWCPTFHTKMRFHSHAN